MKRRHEDVRSWGARLALAPVVLVVFLSVVWPGIGVGVRVWGEWAAGRIGVGALSPSLRLLATTLGWALSIGCVSCLLGWPAAQYLRGKGWRGLALVVTPLALPTYLAYSGLGLLRAPRTWLGDAIETLAQNGAEWLPVVAGRVTALIGLSLWAWPLSAIILSFALRQVDPESEDAMRATGAGRLRRWWHQACVARAGVLHAVAGVALVMLGSAVPLHLANAPTYSVVIWQELMLSPGAGAAWVRAWPLLALAIVGGWWAGRLATRSISVRDATRSTTPSALPVWGVLLVSVGLPFVLFALSSVGGFGRFFSLNGGALFSSALVAGMVGLTAACIGVGVWCALSTDDSLATGVARGVVGVLCVAALVPGVLVGQALAIAYSGGLSDSPVVLTLGHVARFGAIAAIVGCWLTRAEGAEQRDLRRLGGASGARGWLIACVPGRVGGVVGAAMICGAMSLHEIETSVLLRPPGVESLSQVMLGYLHYFRMEELSAGAIVLVAIAATCSVLGAAIAARVEKPGVQ